MNTAPTEGIKTVLHPVTDLEAAKAQVAGTARSMGVKVS